MEIEEQTLINLINQINPEASFKKSNWMEWFVDRKSERRHRTYAMVGIIMLILF